MKIETTTRHKRMRTFLNVASLTCAAVVALRAGRAAMAQDFASQTPKELENVDILQKLGDSLPLDLEFTDENGETVTLAKYINGDRPVILTPVYYNCPQLCTLVLNGLVDALNRVELEPGKDFDIVTFSFAYDEKVELASRKKAAYLTQYRKDGAKDGWHFLIGSKESVDTLLDEVGFYVQRQDDGQIAHSASLMFITPDGTISRYMNDVLFEPRDVRLALVDASEGTISAPMDKFLLFNCFVYDPESGSFVPSAWKIMRFFGGLSAILLGMTIFTLFRLEAKKRRDMGVFHSPVVSGIH